MTRRRFRAARGWPARVRVLRLVLAAAALPGNVLRLSSSCSPCCGPSRTTRRARSADERALAQTLHDDFRDSSRGAATGRGRPERNAHTGAPDVSLDDTPSGTNAPSVCVETRDANTVVVLGAGAEDACRVVADRTATYGDASQTEDTSHVDAGEAFKKRGNAAFENGDYSTAIEAYGRAIDAPVSYRRLFDEAPRRATYHANRAAASCAWPAGMPAPAPATTAPRKRDVPEEDRKTNRD